jgi:hypothetical protein
MLINGVGYAMLIFWPWESCDIMSDDLMMTPEVGVTVQRVIQSPPGDFLINILSSDLGYI